MSIAEPILSTNLVALVAATILCAEFLQPEGRRQVLAPAAQYRKI